MNSEVIAARIAVNLETMQAAMDSFLHTFPLSAAWIQRDWQLHTDNISHGLLNGAKIALLEAATAWSIGSNRGAAASLRAATENAFAWLYYKDHPLEFRAVSARRADLLLPKAVQSYFKSIDAGFESAYTMLAKTKSRPNEYFYTDLSQFVHAHPDFNTGQSIIDAAISHPRDGGFLAVLKSIDEFISDNYLAHYRNSWGDFPEVVQIAVTDRLGVNLAKFVELGQ